jgi:exopolyphosphatase/guanosine-5'-triphosphate,3'-diphosphate pyrophosphatase
MDAPQPSPARRKSRRASRSRRQHGAPVLAAIDLGSNNCRLLIAVPRRGGGFRVIDSFSRTVRLGEGVAQTGRLAEAAIVRTVEALRVCAERLARHRGLRLRAIATEACRRAANADDLLARVRADTGIELHIISAEEEARLAAVGCAPLLGEDYEGALVFDIGGGSTEIVWIEAGRSEPVYSGSVPVGVVSLAETHGADGSFAVIRDAIVPSFAQVAARMAAVRPFPAATHHLLGTSGTVTTLAALALDLPRYDREKVDGSWHACDHVLAISDWLTAMDLAGRAALGPVGPDRADLVVAGSAVFAAIHAHWPCAHLRVADRGLREGMLRELMMESSGKA